MAAEDLLPIYLLTGGDRPKIRRALSRLRARFPDEACEVLSAENAGGDDAVAACNALGLFGGEAAGRLVIVEGVESWKADDAGVVAAYVTDPVPGAVLALVVTSPLRGKKLTELCKKSGKVLEFETPRPRDLPAWVRSQFERLGQDVDADTAAALAEIVGDKVEVLEREIEKIVVWAAGEPIERHDVEALAISAQEAPPWDLTDAWSGRDPAGVLQAAERAIAHGKEPFVIGAGLTSHVRFVRDVEALADEGLTVREIAKHTRKHEFRVRKALTDAERYSREERNRVLERLAGLDAALKGASRLSAELELEQALVDATRPTELP